MTKAAYRRLVLIGYRGVGKTTIGRQLAKDLVWPYHSTDQMIEDHLGQPISEFVAASGWTAFRDIESDIIMSLEGNINCVIDCGGGVIERAGNMASLSESSLVIWIDAAIDDIIARIAGDRNRPLLNQGNMIDDIKANYLRREPIYDMWSQQRISSSDHSAADISKMITALL